MWYLKKPNFVSEADLTLGDKFNAKIIIHAKWNFFKKKKIRKGFAKKSNLRMIVLFTT